MKTQVTAHAGDDVEQGEHFSIAGGGTIFYKHFGIQCGNFWKIGNQSTSRAWQIWCYINHSTSIFRAICLSSTNLGWEKSTEKKCYSDMVASRNIFIKRRAAVLSKIYKYMVLMT